MAWVSQSWAPSTSSDGTRPPGQGVDADPVVCDPVLEDPVRDGNVPAGKEGAGLDAADCPDLSGKPEVDDPIDPTGQGLSPTPEGTSGSLPCGQRMVTPELSDSTSSSFEIISDTESEKRPVHRTAPASEALGTLGSSTGADTERPPLRFDDLFALARSVPVETYDVVAENIRQEFQTVHDRDTLTALLMAWRRPGRQPPLKSTSKQFSSWEMDKRRHQPSVTWSGDYQSR